MTKYYIIAILLLLQNIVYPQITITVDSDQHSQDSSVYIAGSFQEWNPNSINYKLNKLDSGKFQLTFNPPIGNLEFKFTQGSWDTVEGNSDGEPISNRTYNYTGGNVNLALTIDGWEKQNSNNIKSTAQNNVFVLEDSFMIPQLNRTRKIWIYLPPDYSTSKKEYPVLYMLDGQNLFDEQQTFSGEWNVDETLNKLQSKGDHGVIVVGIENGQTKRIDEYSPWVNPNYGGGEGEEYIDFIVNTLKVHIDSLYRTLPEREYTAIMGSSMGGLISCYGGIKYQNVFSKIGIFSPSYWFSKDIYNHVINVGKTHPTKIYTIIGALEGTESIQNVRNMEQTLLKAGFHINELKTIIHSDGKHNEKYWAREFTAAYTWLFTAM